MGDCYEDVDDDWYKRKRECESRIRDENERHHKELWFNIQEYVLSSKNLWRKTSKIRKHFKKLGYSQYDINYILMSLSSEQNFEFVEDWKYLKAGSIENFEKPVQTISDNFSKYSYVSTIATTRNGDNWKIEIFYLSEHYDDAKMDELLKSEIVVMHTYPNKNFSFSYFPHTRRDEVVGTIPDYYSVVYARPIKDMENVK